VLVRNTAQTHLVDADNRTVKLPVVARTPSTVTVALPSSTNVLPNGPYLLFAVAGAGGNPAKDVPGQVVPSIGQQVFVTGTSVPRLLPAPAPAAKKATAAKAAAAPHPGAVAAQPLSTVGPMGTPPRHEHVAFSQPPAATPPRRMA